MSTELEKQLKNLFNSLRMDKEKTSPVERTALITLFQYHSMDTQMPQYYRYLIRSLQKLPDENVREEDFLKIVMNPDMDLTLASKEEMADAFSLLDIDREGSIDMNKFLQMYESSENFQLLSAAQKKDIIDEIKQAFFSINEAKKITPMEFYDIVKFKSN